MMVQWGNDLADQLLLPAWVEASEYGHDLYASMGYDDIEFVNLKTKSWTSRYTHMRRPKKVQRMAVM
jgi:hypothetical protein